MRRVFRKGVAVALAAAMVVTLAPASADAAKKPSIAKKASVKVGKTTTIKVKNGKAKATVTWKTSKKSVAKLGKQVKKGNKASVVVKGVKKGKATITAVYKLGKKKTNLKCVVTVSGGNVAPATATPTTAPATAKPTNAPATGAPTATPTAEPTKEPTGTPKPTPTPSPRPKNSNLDAYKLGLDEAQNEIAITVDGKIDDAWEDSVANPLLTDITKESGIRGEGSAVTDATAKIMWGDTSAYVLVEVAKANPGDKDSVTIYFDENAKATKDTVQKTTVKAGEAGKSTKTDKGYIVEAKFDIKAAKEVDSTASIEIQINEEKSTINYYDTRSAMVLNEETKEFELGDKEVAVADKPELMGQLTLLKSMAQSTLAYKTSKGAEIRAAADIDNGEWDVAAGDDGVQTVKAKKVKFVDTKYWTEAYGTNPAIKFPNYNAEAYAPDGRKSENITLMKKIEDGVDEEGNPKYKYESDPELAKGYVIWDEDYLYVLFDIKDEDVTPNDVDNPYLVDSTEFFLDEDNSKPSSYTEGGDEIQVRVAATDNAYSSEDTAKTGSYELVAHAAKVTEKGYQTQYIIKLNNKHKHGDIMGMDLQVNDCETIDVESTDEAGAAITVTSSARACTITAYDTANEDWENPSYFGRVKLIDPDAAPEDPSNPGDNENPGDDNPGEVVTDSAIIVDLTKTSLPGWGTTATVTPQADGSVKLSWAADATDYTGVTFTLDTPMDLTGYTCVIDAEGSTMNVNIEDASRKEPVWGNAFCVAKPQYGAKFPFSLELNDANLSGDNDKDGKAADYKTVGRVTIYKGTGKEAYDLTVKSIKFIKK